MSNRDRIEALFQRHSSINWHVTNTGGGSWALHHDTDDGGYLLVTSNEGDDVPKDLSKGATVGYYTRDKGEGCWCISIVPGIPQRAEDTIFMIDALLTALNRRHLEREPEAPPVSTPNPDERNLSLPNVSRRELAAILAGLAALEHEFQDGYEGVPEALKGILTDEDTIPPVDEASICQLAERINRDTADA